MATCMVQVCAMREQRLDQDDIIGDITKSSEQVRKDQESLKQKLQRIDQALAATESDIQDFQREKQASLNEIDVMVMLRAHQIEYLVDQRLPTDLSQALVFSNTELLRLRNRIDVCLLVRACCVVLQRVDLSWKLTTQKQACSVNLASSTGVWPR